MKSSLMLLIVLCTLFSCSKKENTIIGEEIEFTALQGGSDKKLMSRKETNGTLQKQSKEWSLEEAIQMMDNSAHVAYGIEDMEIFNEIIERKNQGESQAQYVFALLRLNYDIANDIGLSDKEAQVLALEILFELSKKFHPQASRYLAENYTAPEFRGVLQNALHLNDDELLEKKVAW